MFATSEIDNIRKKVACIVTEWTPSKKSWVKTTHDNRKLNMISKCWQVSLDISIKPSPPPPTVCTSEFDELDFVKTSCVKSTNDNILLNM